MLTRITSATPWGVEARSVRIEVDVQMGAAQMRFIGLAEGPMRESRERVRSALRTTGFELPPRVVTVNLAPADLAKQGQHLDLPITIALLSAHGELPPDAVERRLLCGELGFDGTVRPVRGALAVAELAAREGIQELILPAGCAAEAATLGEVPVIAIRSLRQAVEHLRGCEPIPPMPLPPLAEPSIDQPDLSQVRGQEAAKRALEVAAAGDHNLLMIGPPSAGKTMLARRLPGILPPLQKAESIAVTKIHSLVDGESFAGWVRTRPFRCPHHSISTAGMIGGGQLPRPGEASLAHGGVLFLDELADFRRDAIDALRQPLEEGEVTVVRSRARYTFPARFVLLAAMTPCPCGHLGDPRQECRCAPQLIERYRSRISRRLLDHIDIHVEVPALSLRELKAPPGERSADIASRVLAARSIQQARFGDELSAPVNAAMGTESLRLHAVLEPDARRLLDVAFERLNLSAKGVDRVLRVARTVADLDGSEQLRAAHVAEAIQYRRLDAGQH